MTWMLKLKEMVLGEGKGVTGTGAERFVEKRMVPRISCFIEAAFTTDESLSFDGHITVLEMSGMRCLTPVRLVKGQKLIVGTVGHQGAVRSKPYRVDTLNAQVVWCKRKKGFPHFYAGLKFGEDDETIRSSWVFYVLLSFGVAGTADFQRRKNMRVQASLPVKCFYEKNKSLSGTAYDIGLGGIKAHFRKDPGKEREVALHIGPYRMLPRIKCLGRVRRSSYNIGADDFAAGIQFIELDEKRMKLIGKYIMLFLRESAI